MDASPLLASFASEAAMVRECGVQDDEGRSCREEEERRGGGGRGVCMSRGDIRLA
jgi:hypothetical protein